MKSSLLAVLTLLLVLGGGCDRRVEPFIPADQEPPPPARPVRIPGLEKAQPRNRPATSNPLPIERAEPARPTRPTAPPIERGDSRELAISGTLELESGERGGGSGVVFVIVRSGAGGPPLAVKRLPAGPFPMQFSIGPTDMMIPGREFAGELTLTARLDRDGNPLTRGADDYSGAAAGPVTPGSAGIAISLARGD